MNKIAKDLGIELKPFCVRSDEFPTDQMCQDVLNRCVSIGARAVEGVKSTIDVCCSKYYKRNYCEYWGIDDALETLTSDQECHFEDNILEYQEMLEYLQLTEKDGRLVPNEEVIKENNPMHTVDVANGTVQLHKFPDNACVEAPVSSSEPVSMIKGRVVPAELERLLELIVGEYKKDHVLLCGFPLPEYNSMSKLLESVEEVLQEEDIENYCLFSEHKQVTLDKQIKEAENTILEAQQRLDELKKQRGE